MRFLKNRPSVVGGRPESVWPGFGVGEGDGLGEGEGDGLGEGEGDGLGEGEGVLVPGVCARFTDPRKNKQYKDAVRGIMSILAIGVAPKEMFTIYIFVCLCDG